MLPVKWFVATSLLLGLLVAPVLAQEPASWNSPASAVSAPAPEQADGDLGAESDSTAPARDFMNPSGGAMNLGGDTGFGLGTAIGDPTALNGPDRTEPVLNGTTRSSTIDITGYYIYKPAENQRILVEVNADPQFVGADLSYSWQPNGWKGVLSSNFFISSSRFAPFQEATPDVILPNLEKPFLQRRGFGVEYVQEIAPNLDLAAGLNYQNFDFSDSLLGGTSFDRDFTGTPLAFGERAQGDLYALNLNGVYSTFDDRNLPTQGTKIRVGAEQAVNMGNTSTAYTRLAANLTQLFRVPGFNDDAHSLALNLQAGSILGTSPQVRGFHLGGPFSVRGYQPGEMASGTSFLQASLEYRHHLTSFSVRDTEIELRGEAFVDYGTVLGTEKALPGIPEYLWNKPTSGTGYGVGLHFATDFGLFRLETAWNNNGGNSTYVSIGERF